MTQQLTTQQIAWRVAQDMPSGSCAYLGSGMPLLVRGYVAAGHRISFYGENSLRAGRFDYCVLGADEVAENGDLASRDLSNAPAAAKYILAMMEYFAKDGSARIVPNCTLPLTGSNCVTTVYTDIAVLDLTEGKVWVRELIEGITLHTLQAETDIQLQISPQLKLLNAPQLP